MNYEKSILPTETVYHSAINVAGACQLPSKWTSCSSGTGDSVLTNGFCYSGSSRRKSGLTHDFDELTTNVDAITIDRETVGSIHHYMLYRDYKASSESSKNVSLYRDRYSDSVLNDLHNRGLKLMIEINDRPTYLGPPVTPVRLWVKLFKQRDIQENHVYLADPEKSYNFHLPNNFSTRMEEDYVKLPNFSIDYSEYLMGAMIERESNTFNLHATMFFLCQNVLEPKDGESAAGGERINSEVYDVWKKAMIQSTSTLYTANGIRSIPSLFYCNISNNGKAPYYIVKGQWIPNRLTPDSNGNKRLDILRCKLENTELAYMTLAGTNNNIHIELIKLKKILNNKKFVNFSLMKFTIPWGSRKTGFMLDENDPTLSIYNAWNGFDKKKPGIWKHDNIHLCIPGWEDIPNKYSLPLFLEFIQHHLLLGVDHIFTGLLFSYKSKQTELIKDIFGSFVEEGKLSFTSHSGDGIDGAYR